MAGYSSRRCIVGAEFPTALREEIAERAADRGKLAVRFAPGTAAVFLVSADRLDLPAVEWRGMVRCGLASALFFFFIAFPLCLRKPISAKNSHALHQRSQRPAPQQ